MTFNQQIKEIRKVLISDGRLAAIKYVRSLSPMGINPPAEFIKAPEEIKIP